MAKNEYSGKPTTYLNIDYRKYAWMHGIKTTDEKEIAYLESVGYERREVENKKDKSISVKYVKSWPSVTGYLTGLRIDDGPFGQVLCVRLEDEDEANILNIPFISNGKMGGYAVDFIKHIGNIPLNEKITISINRKLENKNGYKVQMLGIQFEERRGEKGKLLMERVLNKDNMPALRQYQIAGKDNYDSTERDQFLAGVLEKFIAEVDANRIVVPMREKEEKKEEPVKPYNPNETPKENPTPTPVNTAVIDPNEPQQDPSKFDDLPF